MFVHSIVSVNSGRSERDGCVRKGWVCQEGMGVTGKDGCDRKGWVWQEGMGVAGRDGCGRMHQPPLVQPRHLSLTAT